MKRTLAIVSVLGVALAAPGLAGSALAQQRPSGIPGSTGERSGVTPPASSSETMTSVPGTGTAEVKGNRLIGADVKGAGNEKIGDVSEVLVSTDGKVNGVVVSVGGFLGMGDHKVALPWEQLRFSSEGDNLVVVSSFDKEALKNMPEYQDPAKASRPAAQPGADAPRDMSRPIRPAPTQ